MLEVITVEEAVEKVVSSIKEVNKNNRGGVNLPEENKKSSQDANWELLEGEDSLDRVLFEPLYSPLDLPPFTRSTVDGYAVKAEDTFGVSESMPGVFELKGKVEMGDHARIKVDRDEVGEIATGGMLPEGTDAVVMLEETELLGDDSILINRSVSPGENVIKKGEDVREGEMVFQRGHEMRKQDLGALAALGITSVKTFKKPKVGIISTGDELISPKEELTPGKIRDINSWALKGAVEKAGGVGVLYGICKDDKKTLEATFETAIEENEVVIISGGSSVGEKDVTADVIDSYGAPGVIFHGVSLKPGKPTIYGMVREKPVFGLSGNPVSALVTFDLFVKKAIDLLQGKDLPVFTQKIKGRLTRNISSKGGREDYVRVMLKEKDTGELEVSPVLGESGLIFTLVQAEGMIKIPQNTEGIASGEEVEVYLI